MLIGTEHEYSINDPALLPRPESDRIISGICGAPESEIPFAGCRLSKELQKTVLEFIPPEPADRLSELEAALYSCVRAFSDRFRGTYRLLGLGMHPTLRLGETRIWNHEEQGYYRAYNRLFSLSQHGWMNIQAFQLNLSYRDLDDAAVMYNNIRSLLPYLIAVSAASPFVEGRNGPAMDSRLCYYRENQARIPEICSRIIPERLGSIGDYRARIDRIFEALRAEDAGILCEEWIDSAGVIIRSSRPCVEVKAIDEQECLRSDMAVGAFLTTLLRAAPRWLDNDRDTLLDLTESAIRDGTAGLRPELERLYREAWKIASAEEGRYLRVIRDRIDHGSLAELMQGAHSDGMDLRMIMERAAESLVTNTPLTGPGAFCE
jgi:hypothetical protein